MRNIINDKSGTRTSCKSFLIFLYSLKPPSTIYLYFKITYNYVRLVIKSKFIVSQNIIISC